MKNSTFNYRSALIHAQKQGLKYFPINEVEGHEHGMRVFGAFETVEECEHEYVATYGHKNGMWVVSVQEEIERDAV